MINPEPHGHSGALLNAALWIQEPTKQTIPKLLPSPLIVGQRTTQWNNLLTNSELKLSYLNKL
jgi:hypothetical protein